MSNTVLKVFTPLLVLAASAGAFALLHAAKPEPQKSKEEPRPISVYTQGVKQEHISLQVITQGDVRARTQIELISQVAGRIVSVSREFTEGGTIQPNTSLLKIEDADYRLQLKQASASVAEALISVQQAEADADVARKQLRGTPNASPLALKKPQLAGAKARLLAAEASLAQTSLNLERTNVSLPFKGRLISTRVDIGQYVVPGTVIGRAFATDVVEIRLPLNDSQLASLGLPIGYTAPEGGGPTVNFSAKVAGQAQQWQGKLIRLDASIDPDTRMLYASAQVTDPYGKNVSNHDMPLAVGLFVEAEISGRELADAYTIPRDALRAGDVVFLIKDGRLEVRSVTVVHRSANRTVISAGLDVGERVITSPIRNPVPGMALSEITSSIDKN